MKTTMTAIEASEKASGNQCSNHSDRRRPVSESHDSDAASCGGVSRGAIIWPDDIIRFHMRLTAAFVVCAACALIVPHRAVAQEPAPDGAALYRQHCASCHDNGAARAPDREALAGMLPQRVLDALETGQMISMATGRSAAERRALAEF